MWKLTEMEYVLLRLGEVVVVASRLALVFSAGLLLELFEQEGFVTNIYHDC